MAASTENVPRLIQVIITSHTQCACLRQHAIMGLQQLRIYISTDDRWFAKHCGFQNLKYCTRSKGFLEHLEALLYRTVPEIFAFGSTCLVASMWTDVK